MQSERSYTTSAGTRLDTMAGQDMAGIETACRRLCIDMVNSVDARDYERAVGVFTPDAILIAPDMTIRGHADIRDFLHARPADVVTLHTCSNFFLTLGWDGTASGICYVVCFKAPASQSAREPVPTPAPLVGEYRDQYQYTAAGWRIRERRIRVIFGPVAKPPGEMP